MIILDHENPLPGFGSPTEFHQYVTAKRRCRASATNPCPFRGFFPVSVSQSRRATYIREGPTSAVTLRPQGFAPSRRFAPFATSRAYSIPDPLLGFTLRGLDPPVVPYVLSNAVSLGAYPYLGLWYGSLQGLAHHEKPGHQAWSSARLLVRVPPWAFRSKASCRWRTTGVSSTNHPLSRFYSTGRKRTIPSAPQGFLRQRRSCSLPRSAWPSCGSSPHYPSRRFGFPVRLGYCFPSEAYLRHRRSTASSSPYRRVPGRSLPREPYR